MTARSSPHNRLFLIELIISIFFFIVSCAITIQLFSKSYGISQDAANCNNALLYTQNIAEIFLGNDGNFDAVKAAYSDMECADDKSQLLLLFDKNWYCTSNKENAFFAVYAESYNDDKFSYVDIYTYEYSKLYTDDCIHKQTIKKYRRSI